LGDFLNLVLVWSYHEEEEEEFEDDVENENVGRGLLDNEDDRHRLRYYQGFHDVGSIILSALGGASSPSIATPSNSPPSVSTTNSNDSDNDNGNIQQHSSAVAANLLPTANAASSMGLNLACQVLLRLSRSHLRDAMRSNFRHLQSALKLIVMPLLAAFDAELHSHLFDCEMEPYFCLSWVITWFSHDVRDTALVKRLYDFFIVSHPLMSVYMSVAMMIHPLNRIEVLGADCDFACVHNALADLPKNSSNVGWKYLPGEENGAGYVTGSEGEEDSYDPSMLDMSLDSGGGVENSEDEGSVVGGARVPFQELIDLSISLMHKIPPRNLIQLAQRYHTEITLQPLMAQASAITLLQPPPSWGLASSTTSDWVLRQKLLKESGMKLNRHQRKNLTKLKKQASSLSVEDQLCFYSVSGKKIQHQPSIQAIIASGTGPDGRAEMRAVRKKRKMMVRGSVAVVAISILVVFVSKSYFAQPPAPNAKVSELHRQQQQQQQQRMMTEDVAMDDDSGEDAPMLLEEELDVSIIDANEEEQEEVAEQDLTDEFNKETEEIDNPTSRIDDESEIVIIDTNGGEDHSTSVVEQGEIAVQPQTAGISEEEEKIETTSKKQSEDARPDNEVAVVPKTATTNTRKEDKIEEHQQSSTVSRDTILHVLMRTMILFVKSLKRMQNNTVDLHLDVIEQHLDMLMMNLMETAKTAWLNIAPVVLKALHIGWFQLMKWKDIAAPVLKQELEWELEGASFERAEDAVKIWKKQEGMLRHQGENFIHRSILVSHNVRKLARLVKVGKDSLSEN